jgi:hypothetical protein
MISRQKQSKPQTEEALCSPSNSTVWKHVTMCPYTPSNEGEVVIRRKMDINLLYLFFKIFFI